jgi:hypothetical protein
MTGKMPGYAAIVIDAKGNVYLREHQRGKVHHSTLAGGEPVMFAGFAKVVNGKIVDLNNFTGHYKSGKDELEFAKNRLRGCLAENAQLSIIGKSYALGYDIDKHSKSIPSKLGIGNLLKFLGMNSTTVEPVRPRSLAQENQELVSFLKDYFKVIRGAIEAYKNTSKSNRDSDYRRILDLETRLDRAEVLLNCDDIDDQEKIQLAQFYVLSKVDDIISGKDYTRFHRKTESSLDTILGRQIKQAEMRQKMVSLRAALRDDTPESGHSPTRRGPAGQ